jgi:hypothetical protein
VLLQQQHWQAKSTPQARRNNRVPWRPLAAGS